MGWFAIPSSSTTQLLLNSLSESYSCQPSAFTLPNYFKSLMAFPSEAALVIPNYSPERGLHLTTYDEASVEFLFDINPGPDIEVQNFRVADKFIQFQNNSRRLPFSLWTSQYG